MKKISFIVWVFLITFGFSQKSISQTIPGSFADLAERLMPSVVNISTTQTVVTKNNPFPGFEFPPGSPFGDMFKDFGSPQKRKESALGSGFVIDKNGTVISPPPIPNKPAKKPTGKAVSIIKIIKNEYSFDSIELINLTYLMHPWS